MTAAEILGLASALARGATDIADRLDDPDRLDGAIAGAIEDVAEALGGDVADDVAESIGTLLAYLAARIQDARRPRVRVRRSLVAATRGRAESLLSRWGVP